MSAITKKGGCGCGGSAGQRTTLPTTGATGVLGGPMSFPGVPTSGDVCSPCEEAAFLRPRFFAGQLLTEDDLGALVEYVVAKDRLHNARLFGPGIVCGFEVTCGPCGGGKVIVKPGYALDCCGNDLVLPCDRELDVNAMVAELRKQLRGGWDCGDPCPKSAAGQHLRPEQEKESSKTTKGELPEAQAQPREYCLYVRYTEQPSDVVATYPIADDCEGVRCEATRIREGVTFELRCCTDEEREDLFTRVSACIERLQAHDRQASDALSLQRSGRQIDDARKRLADPIRQFTEEERKKWKTWLDRLPHLDFETPDGAMLVQLGQFLVEVGGLCRRVVLYGPTTPSFPDVSVMQGALQKAHAKVDARAKSEISSHLEQVIAEEGARMYEDVTGYATGALREDTFPRQLYLRGGLLTPATYLEYTDAMRVLRANLIEALDCKTGATTDCTLASDVLALALPPSSQKTEQQLGTDDAAAIVTATDPLVQALLRYVADCICLALNPPCQPCDDPAVLLARIEVEGCKVVQVCDMARTFVLSPRAVRYWLPPLTWLGDLVEEACCHIADLAAAPEKAAARIVTSQKARFAYNLVANPSIASFAAARPTFYRRGIDAAAFATTAGRLGALAASRVPAELFQRPAVRTPPDRADAAAMAGLNERIKNQEEAIRTLSDKLSKVEAKQERAPRDRR